MSLGFAAGVMTAASFWSLLKPALAQALSTSMGVWACLPVAVAFVGGGYSLSLLHVSVLIYKVYYIFTVFLLYLFTVVYV